MLYDMRGHGRTGPSSLLRYSTRVFADDLRALLTNLRIERPIICGLSLGGMVAQAYATAYPDDLAALILCGTAVSTTFTLADKAQIYPFGWSIAPSVRLMGARLFVDYALWVARHTRGEAWLGHNRHVRDYVRACMRAYDTDEMAKIYDMIINVREVALEKIPVPTLIINGEHESRGTLRQSEYMQQVIPHAQAAIIPAAGHTSNMENPERFNTTVLRFLRDYCRL